MRGLLTVLTVTLVLAGTCAADATPDKTTETPAAFEMRMDGTTIIIRPHAAIETGYDSNLDGAHSAKGSWFEKTGGGFNFKADRPGQAFHLSIAGQDFRFPELEKPHRWDVEVAGGVEYALWDSAKLKFETSFLRDYYPSHPAEVGATRLELVETAKTFNLRLMAKATAEHSLSGAPGPDFDGDYDGSGPDDPDAMIERVNGSEYDTSDPDQDYPHLPRNTAFDVLRFDAHMALMVGTDQWLQPFVIANAAILDYFSQSPLSLIDRNATEQFAVAGVRLKPSSAFWVDIGGRVNHRDFDDLHVSQFTSVWGDTRLYWQVNDDLKFTGRIERFIREPVTSLGLADDVRTFGLSMDWRVSEDVRVVAKGTFDQFSAVGEVAEREKLFGRLDVFYALSDRIELFTSVLGRHFILTTTDTATERVRASAGVNVKF
ncbi:MAG: outer membrane beta-barrel protein [Hyphomicrobium sp.]